MRPVLQQLSAAFSRKNKDVLFDLRGGGSSLGEEQARTGQITLGASTLLPPVATDTSTPMDDGLTRVPIALDGIAVVVHPTNDLQGLSLVQLRDLYAGAVLDWMQLGGTEGEVLLVSREEGSGTRTNFEARVMGETPVSLTAVVMPTSADVVEYVARSPQAIGYVSAAYLRSALEPESEGSERADVGVRVLAVEGENPAAEAIAEQRYPLVQPLYLVSANPPRDRARAFVDFVISPAGQEIVARFHAPLRDIAR